jgi:hypothetical protein
VETIEAFGFAIKVGSNLLNGTPFYFVLFLFSTNDFFLISFRLMDMIDCGLLTLLSDQSIT